LIRLERVCDWDRRIAGYSEEVRAIYAKVWQVEKEYDELLVNNTLLWKNCHYSKIPGEELHYEQAISRNGFELLRIRGKTDHDAITSWRAYLDSALRMDYDRNI